MRTFFLVLCLVVAGCSGGAGATGSGSEGGGGHPFQDARGSGGSGGAGGGSGGSTSSETSSGGAGGDGASSTGAGAGGGGGSSCGDTMSDPDNCGSCGRSCLGASCAHGLCVSTLIGGPAATSLAVNSAAVVWGAAQGARAADLDGSAIRSVILGVAVRVPAVAANDDVTAFVVGTDVVLFDAAAMTKTSSQPATSPVALAADEDHVYWAEGSGHAGLYAIDTATDAVVQVAYPAPAPSAMSAGDGLVCWTAFTTAANGALRCVPATDVGSGAGLVLKQDLSSPCSVAVAAGEIFWSECPAPSSTTVSEASDQDGSGFMGLSSMAAPAVATDGVYAYWADHGVFRRIEIASGVIEDRGLAPSVVDYLVAGPDRLYWSNTSGVHWVAK